MATGRYPHESGVMTNAQTGENSTTLPTMHGLLGAAGYALAHFGRNHIAALPPLAHALSWESWVDLFSYQDHAARSGILTVSDDPRFGVCRSWVQERTRTGFERRLYSNAVVSTWSADEECFEDRFYARRAGEYLRDKATGPRRSRPFALFLNLWSPHPPLVVPERLRDLFPPGDIRLPRNSLEVPSGEPANRRRGVAARLAEGMGEAQVRAAWSAYLALTHLADEQIGELVGELKSLGIYDESVICFTSDHGDFLGQRRMYQKMELYEAAVHVPLLIKPAGPVNAQIVGEPVSQVDLLPTLANLCGFKTPETGCDGVNLFENGRFHAPKARALLCQYRGNPEPGDTRLGVVKGDFKYVWDPDDAAELYNLADDPLEMRNLSGDPALTGIERSLRETAFARYGVSDVPRSPNGHSPAAPPQLNPA